MTASSASSTAGSKRCRSKGARFIFIFLVLSLPLQSARVCSISANVLMETLFRLSFRCICIPCQELLSVRNKKSGRSFAASREERESALHSHSRLLCCLFLLTTPSLFSLPSPLFQPLLASFLLSRELEHRLSSRLLQPAPLPLCCSSSLCRHCQAAFVADTQSCGVRGCGFLQDRIVTARNRRKGPQLPGGQQMS